MLSNSLFIVLILSPTMAFMAISTSEPAEAGNDEENNLGITDIDELNDRIDGIEIASGIVKFGNIITCAAFIVCNGTDNDDVIYSGALDRAFAKDGNDIVYGGLSNQIYGGGDDDLLISGAGKVYVDGGPGDDTLMAGLGNALLAGGKGNDKLFAGPATSVMYGGEGANNFDCPLSALGLARSVVMDYNPSNGDTLSGPCKIINTVGDSDSENTFDVLPDTGDSEGGSTPVIPGVTG